MKKHIYYFSLALLLGFTFLVFKLEGIDKTTRTILFEEIKKIDQEEYYKLINNDIENSNNTFLKIKDKVAYDENRDIYYASHSEINISYDKTSNIYNYYDEIHNENHLIVSNSRNVQEIKLIITHTPIINIETIKEKRRISYK